MGEIILSKIKDTNDCEMKLLLEILEDSFAASMADCPETEKDMLVPNREDLLKAIEKGLDVLKIYSSGKLVGGAVLTIDEETGKNTVELLFISAKNEGKGIGTKAWSEIESAYPNTKVWCLGTPYFSKRNIHFYINKCGFEITKYYNKWNPMIIEGIVVDNDFFWFEKKMCE